MDARCVFCKIVAGQVPAHKVLETDTVLAFRDINPVAPTHILVVPKQHIPDPSSLDEETAPLIADLFLAVKTIAAREGLERGGYRLVMNMGADAGQSVPHMHLHVLRGRRMRWPPG